MTEIARGLERYLGVFVDLKPGHMDRLAACFTPDARFKGPFNDVRGRGAIMRAFTHMFTTLDKPQFYITAHALDGNVALLHRESVLRLRATGATANRRREHGDIHRRRAARRPLPGARPRAS